MTAAGLQRPTPVGLPLSLFVISKLEDTRSRLLIEEEMTGDWQGEIRVRTQDGQAAALLQKATKVIEGVQNRLFLKPVDVELPSASIAPDISLPISPGQERSIMPNWYVSYA